MLATFIIGLREGLEAALIIGIIAAFLRSNGRGLFAMWCGVIMAMLLSLCVGLGLDMIEQALPQAAQEGMETVIGGIAVFFVTGMIAWMNRHARSMKRTLEAQAAEALSSRGATALAIMAFLAVLKEGFETAVFLLATFSAAQSAALAGLGAVLGILLAILIGWGIYAGGVRINLSRFFRVTGVFLILVAAGLVVSALRTAHEAGWLDAGQQMTVDLAWLVSPGTVRSALITGVLGIPADPRRIEVIGWFAYLVPVALYVYWPQRYRPTARGALRLRLALGAWLMAAALALALLYPEPRLTLGTSAPLAGGGSAQLLPGDAVSAGILLVTHADGETARLPLPDALARPEDHAGITAEAWHLDRVSELPKAPRLLTLDQVVALAGGRIPLGLNAAQHPGPYDARWTLRSRTDVWTSGHRLLDAREAATAILALSGSGLAAPRILSLSQDAVADAAGWSVAPAYVAQASAALSTYRGAARERQFWAGLLPVLLLAGGLILLLVTAWRGRPRHHLDIPLPATRPGGTSPHDPTKDSAHAAE
ncbi:iron uptake transporter permease EfeU [Acidisoma sp. C75]